jgi:cardiolipin synthase
MMKRALVVAALLVGCAPEQAAEAPEKAPVVEPVERAPEEPAPVPAVAVPRDERAMLRFVHRSDLPALRARGVSEATAKAVTAHRAGPDGVRGTSDDGEVYTLADLGALGASVSDLDEIGRAASATGPVDEACSATTPRSLPSELIVTPDQGDARVLSLIAGATISIEVVMYQLSATSVQVALAEAHARGVRVRVILDRAQSRTDERVAAFRAKGVEAQASSESFSYSHQKTLLVDGKKLFVFSGNFDRASFTTGRNFGVVVRDPEDLWDVHDLFEADWNERKPDLTCTRLVVAPVNAKSRVVAFIDGAKTELAVEALYASDKDVVDAIVRAANRGVTVRVLFNDPAFGVGDATDTAALFTSHGIPVRRSPDLFIHAKLIVADRESAFIGSENFSTNSLLRNREVGVIVSTKDVDVGAVMTVFERDFAAGAAFP